MAYITIKEFERKIFNECLNWESTNIPVIVRVTPTSIKIRININVELYIDCFFNEIASRTSFSLIENEKRIFGANNTGEWHIHPFENPSIHKPIKQAVDFKKFIKMVDRYISERS